MQLLQCMCAGRQCMCRQCMCTYLAASGWHSVVLEQLSWPTVLGGIIQRLRYEIIVACIGMAKEALLVSQTGHLRTVLPAAHCPTFCAESVPHAHCLYVCGIYATVAVPLAVQAKTYVEG